ncbi:CYCLINS [Salix viminalis]|uniref:CYCLINS n=1 Tax=Salix viminalis TaxID=40686 RepID=A0A9Q0QHT8_SALVM|nr:CYCLINS [Salix viminalis]
MKQGEEAGFIFDTQTINRMELLILDALNWRMRSITPFSFVHFFISVLELKDPSFSQPLKDRATEIIFKAQNGNSFHSQASVQLLLVIFFFFCSVKPYVFVAEIKFLEFKPSIVAASALLVASNELLPLQFPFLKCSISSCALVNKERLLNCFNALQEMVEMECYESMLDTMSCTRTPLSVLDRHCTKSESETASTTSITDGSAVTEIKRRKLNGYGSK